MRVLQLSKTPEGAGWAVHQVRELTRLGIDVHVAVPSGQPAPQLFAEAGATVHLVDLGLPVRVPWLVPTVVGRLRRLVAEVSPDVIHSHFVSTTITMRIALGRRHPIPRVFQVAGPLHLEHRMFRAAEIATAGPLDHWIASCRWTEDRYRRSGVDESRLALSYLGTDVTDFTARPTGKLRSELQLGDEQPLIGMVAHMYAPKRYLRQRRGLKGHEDLIDAIALIAPDHPAVRAAFIGGAWNGKQGYEDRVRSYGRRECGDRVVFLGHRTDVTEIYPDVDVAVHPSHSENVGGAVESLLSGVPTVATAVGGLPDVVIPGETGWLVDPRNPASIADALREVLADLSEARRRAARGRELVAELFDVKTTAKQIADIYEQVVSGSGIRS